MRIDSQTERQTERRLESEVQMQKSVDINKSLPMLYVLPFLAMHIVPVVAVVYLGWSWKGFALAIALYYVRMFGVTGGYHRYFAHRTYKTGRVFQFVLAVLAMSSFQKGVLWWAAHHRAHHKFSDLDGDIHSMKRDGFWWSHVGWIVSPVHEKTDTKRIPDLMKFPELQWMNKYYYAVPIVYAIGCYAIGGFWGLTWGAGISTILLWHGTFTINSLAHWLGRVRYKTGDDSKNSAILAVITMGEGWHNNHHYYQRATNQGFFWWEVDMTFYLLKMLSWTGLVWDLHTPPKHVLAANRVTSAPSVRVDEEDASAMGVVLSDAE